MNTRLASLSVLTLVFTMITSPAYATVEMYNVQLLCPIDSFDFTGVAVEFDALEMCEVSGTVINPDVIDNFYQGGLQYPQITLQIQENPQDPPRVSLREQLDGLFDKQRNDLIAELNDFLRKNYSLKNSLADVELELGQLIKILKEKISLLKTKINQGTSNVNIDDIITEADLDKIARDFLTKQSLIQPAYGDMFVFQERADELIELFQNKTNIELENIKLEQNIVKVDKIKSDLLKEQISVDRKFEMFKNILEKGVDKIKENADDFAKKVKDLFK